MTEYLTTREAAAVIRKSRHYVAAQCKAGQIKAKKLGTDWRIERAALDAFMGGGSAAKPVRPLTARQQRRAS